MSRSEGNEREGSGGPDRQAGPARSLAASDLRAIESICDAFEAAYRAGQQPVLREFLTRGEPPLWDQLFRDLLHLDLEYRPRAGDRGLLSDYLANFPEFEATIRELFEQVGSRKLEAVEQETVIPGDHLANALAPASVSFSETKQYEPLTNIGRFEIRETIGHGSFGSVYRGFDPELRRDVAIKVAQTGHAAGHADLQLLEARVAARLDHPHIVPVYDVGRLPDGRLYIVSRFVPGSDLRSRFREFGCDLRTAAGIVADIATALACAHARGVIHRDVKPENILLDRDGRPLLTDFGLALREEETGEGARFVGTPAYMSPEQARNEGHLVDARSDLFSLSVVLYELVTGRRPFRGSHRGELLHAIATRDPRAPSEIYPQVPAELERIILKGLSRLASDRYASGQTLADDLRAWLSDPTPRQSHDETTLVMVPRGLHAFEEQDAWFYGRLIPGDRGRHGIPEAITFWKSRIESLDTGVTFRVGVLHGPSGSGKSSLVRAGLMPVLGSTVVACRIAASGDHLERDWLQAIRGAFPALTRVKDLVTAMRRIREGEVVSRDVKVVMFLDQLEQWLSPGPDFDSSPVVAALRQCDGLRLQAVLIVRDDHWYSVNRLMQHLDLEIQPSNSRVAELFDKRHAARVLAEFQRAFSRQESSPEGPQLNEQTPFLDQVVGELGSQGPIIPVHLAVFAESFRYRPWTLAELRRVGGVQGAVSRFLDSLLTGPTSHPALGHHGEEVLALLRAILPPSGSTLKEQPRTAAQLSERAGNLPMALTSELLGLLEKQCRIVAAVEATDAAAGGTTYQLTHDYLVPAIREWIARKHPTTLRGHADRILHERTDGWQLHPHRRQLPTFTEWLLILAWTPWRRWPPVARRMMKSAGWRYGSGLLATVAVLVFGVLSTRWMLKRAETAALIPRLQSASLSEVPAIVQEVRSRPKSILGEVRRQLHQLESAATEYSPDGSISPARLRQQLNLRLALYADDATQDASIESALGLIPDGNSSWQVPPIDLNSAITIVRQRGNGIAQRSWSRWSDALGNSDLVLRLGATLAQLAPSNNQWEKRAEQLAGSLVKSQPEDLRDWLGLLQPVSKQLLPHLTNLFRASLSEIERRNLALAYNHFAGDDVRRLVLGVAGARSDQLPIVLSPLREHVADARKEVASLFRLLTEDSGKKVVPNWPAPPKDIVRKLELHHGHLGERAAVVQNLPLVDAEPVLAALATAGYRPTTFRPFAADIGQRVAIGWTRDGGKWKTRHDLSADELRKLGEPLSHGDLGLSDVAAYETGLDAPHDVRFAATLTEPEPGSGQVGLEVDVDYRQYVSATQQMQRRNRVATRCLLRQDAFGRPRITLLWQQLPKRRELEERREVMYEYSYYNGFIGLRQSDCQIGLLAPQAVDQYDAARFTAQRPIDSGKSAQESLLLAYYYLEAGRPRAAAEALDKFSGDATRDPHLADLRVRAWYAANEIDRAAEAAQEFASLVEDERLSALPQLRVALRNGSQSEVQRLVQLLEPTGKAQELRALGDGTTDGLAWERCARAHALVASEQVGQNPEAVDDHRLRSFVALEKCLAGYGRDAQPKKLIEFARDRDFASLREHLPFLDLLDRSGVSARFVGLWSTPTTEPRATRTLASHDLDGHLKLATSRMAHGFSPRALAVRQLPHSKRFVASSVWQKPLPTWEAEVFRHARIANLAIAAATMGDDGPLHKALRDTWGEEVRAFVIERLPQSNIPIHAVVDQLAASSGAYRRHLILALGTYDASTLRSADASRVVAALIAEWEVTPRADIRSACEWCLRSWGKLPKFDQAESLEIPAEANWYRNACGQIMVRLSTPGKILMGAPSWQPNWSSVMMQHYRKMPKALAIATTETTMAAYQQFRRDPRVVQWYVGRLEAERNMGEPVNAELPQVGVDYREALLFCQWLSEIEGLPTEQWCYPDIWEASDDTYQVPADFLERTGYRLPTEAEWEFACRGGVRRDSNTGDAEEILSARGWYIANSGGRSHPVARKKPNDFGLFDMLGNVREWTGDGFRLWYQPAIPRDPYALDPEQIRTIRGSAYDDDALHSQFATRSSFKAEDQNTTVGFRVARTVR